MARSEESRRRQIELGYPRFVWVGRTLWVRTYQQGGYDGYRTIRGRRTVCDTVAREWAARQP